MKIIEIQTKTPILIQQLLDVWEKSVKATHLFLSEREIQAIKQAVPQAFHNIANLIIAENDKGYPVAFMGIENCTLEMLFISPEERGKGIGKDLLNYGIAHYNIQKLAVNEQNPQARGFYEHMGFKACKRSEYDEQGRPYPLIYMSRL